MPENTTTDAERAALARWAANNGPHWYATAPGVEYAHGVGMLPDTVDLARGLLVPLLAALKIRAYYRPHDDAILALRPDRSDGVLTVYSRARLLEITRVMLAALPSVPPAEGDEFPTALDRLCTELPTAYLTAAIGRALDHLEANNPIGDGEPVRLMPRPPRRRRAADLQAAHLTDFLASVPPGTRRTTEVHREYTNAATRSGVKPLSRNALYRRADDELGPRARQSYGEVYRVTTPDGSPAAPLAPEARAILTRYLNRPH